MFKIQIYSDDNKEGQLIDGSDNISTKIKPLSKDSINKANSEIEIGEYVLNNDTMSLHKALGKKHSKGGTPVNLPDNSFIFSDFKDLGFTKEDKNKFELKLGGSKLKNNTPAKVLEKNIDVKHHNKLINILSIDSQDDIAKNSAQLMLQKNVNTIGKIAYVQEGKKSFPQGIPSFSRNTAPVYSKETDQEITQSKQYMKYGGSVIPKYQHGGYQDRQKYWASQGQLYLYPDLFWDRPQHATRDAYGQANIDEFKKRNEWFFNKHPNANLQDPNVIRQFQIEYNNLYKAEFNGENYFTEGDRGFDGKLGAHTFNAPAFIHKNNQFTSNYDDFNNYQVETRDNTIGPIINRNVLTYRNNNNNKTIPNWGDIGLTSAKGLATEVKPNNVNPLNAGTMDYTLESNDASNRVGLTPWQNFNLAYPLLQKANIKSQYPLYQQQRSLTPEQTLYSAQPALNRLDQEFNQASGLNRVVNPQQAYASNSEIFGKKLDYGNQVIAGVNQQNAQIQNSQNNAVAQAYNDDMKANMNYDLNYYNGLQQVAQNKQKYKDYYDSEFMTNANEAFSKNEEFNNALNTQRQYKTNKILRYENGKPVYAAEALYLPQSNGFGYNFVHNKHIDPNIVLDQNFGNNSNASLLAEIIRLSELASNDPTNKAIVSQLIALQKLYYTPQKKDGGYLSKYKL